MDYIIFDQFQQNKTRNKSFFYSKFFLKNWNEITMDLIG